MSDDTSTWWGQRWTQSYGEPEPEPEPEKAKKDEEPVEG